MNLHLNHEQLLTILKPQLSLINLMTYEKLLSKEKNNDLFQM